MGASRRKLGGVVLAAVLTAGLTAGTAGAAPGRADLQQAMEGLAEQGVAGVQLRIHDDDGDWAGSAGVRELSGGKVPTNGRFRAGSITKTFVSTVILQLVDEGRLALDQPVDDYLPEYGFDQRITVRMMLQHTSGLFNYTGDVSADGSFEPGIPLDGQEFVDKRFHRYTPDELIAVSLSKPARFEPGTQWRYSNTNYIIAGQLIERLTGTPYEVQVWHRILKPLGLRETVLPGTWAGLPNPHAHGYFAYQHENQSRVVDITRINPSWADAAGEIISTTRDLDRFVTALVGGRLLPADLLAEMAESSPFAPYGLGLELLDMGQECGGLYLGHTGGMPGYVSYMFSTPDSGTRLELSVTTGDADLTDPEVVERLLAAFNNVLITAVCDSPPADRTLVDERLAVA
jgi:D-alanyl-D-alanine carboxypeptidase